MKKLFILFILFILAVSPIYAATNDFTADSDITVPDVTFGASTANMLIMDTSTAESWEFNSGTFTVTNPGTFMIGSSDSSVKSIKITQGGTNVACAENSTPGSSYATVPTGNNTYTIVPSTTTDCTSLCAAVDNAATLNSFPTCGAATCNSGYELSGSGSSATCVQSSSGSVTAPSAPPPPTTYQTYDPNTGELVITDISDSENTADDNAPNGQETSSENTKKDTENIAETTADTTADAANTATLEQIAFDSKITATGDVNQVIAEIGVKRNLAAEVNFNKTIVAKVIKGSKITAEIRNTITNFVTYGTKATQMLGAGERGGAVNSFKSAFSKLPENSSDWNDVIKIANGRWPSQTSKAAEDHATINFKIVYKRTPDRSNPRDDAAITIMAYGLRPANRNLDSEKTAIKIFKDIYGYNPEKATAWDVVRAIAYSGATR